MFVSFQDDPPPPRWEPSPPPTPRLSPRQQRTLTWLVTANVLGLLVGPLAGTSVVHAIAALFAR